MKKAITTIHNGRKFTLLSTGYFLDNNKKAGERLLHRIIWEENVGPIPSDFDVHHRDGNRINNAIENLELKHHSSHIREHMVLAIKRDPELGKRLTDQLLASHHLCHDWLQTGSGKQWARNHLARLREKTKSYVCAHCGINFQASVIARHKFCSIKCGCRAAYERRKARLAAIQ